jgi:hypothetical protein
MKTTRHFVMISFALIFATGLIAIGGQPQSMSAMPNPHGSQVRYVVKIILTNYVPTTAGPFRIIVTDQTGKAICAAQNFVIGQQDYIFYENGSVTGTRIAQMVKTPPDPKPYVIKPVIKTGTFLRGHTYVFPILPLPFTGTDKVHNE